VPSCFSYANKTDRSAAKAGGTGAATIEIPHEMQANR
jgi:hypothetical protein